MLGDATSAKDGLCLVALFIGLVGRLSIEDGPYFSSADGALLGALFEGKGVLCVHNINVIRILFLIRIGVLAVDSNHSSGLARWKRSISFLYQDPILVC